MPCLFALKVLPVVRWFICYYLPKVLKKIMKDRYTGGQSKRTDETNIANGKTGRLPTKDVLLYKPKWSISMDMDRIFDKASLSESRKDAH